MCEGPVEDHLALVRAEGLGLSGLAYASDAY